MRYAVVIVAVVALLVGGVRPVSAQQCAPGAIMLSDMAGTYLNQELPMRLDVYPCGGVMLVWDNPYGRHHAMYGVSERVPSGGFVARGIMAEPLNVFLDDRTAIGVTPAEPGWVHIVTISPYITDPRVYSLQKIG